MKNLENYGVQALETMEIREIDGGLWLGGKFRMLRKIAEGLGLVELAEEFAEGVAEGWNAKRH